MKISDNTSSRKVYPNTLKAPQFKNYYQFNCIFIASALFPLLAVGLFNIVIDPYGVFNSPKFASINQTKPEQQKHSRLYKAMDIIRIKPTIILLGSSRVETGLDIEHPAFKDKKVTYNLGLEAANTYELRQYFNHALVQQPKLEQLIVGIDFFMFNEHLKNRVDFSEERLKNKIPTQDILNTSLSLDAFVSSKNTLLINLTHQSPNRVSKKIDRFKFWLGGFLRNEELYKNYSFSPERLNHIRTIIDICRKNNIDVKVFISPIHATQHEAIRVAGLWSIFEQWKRELVKIVPIWDFSGYNSVTTEPISDDMRNYIDSSHYSRQTGNLVLDRILSYQQESVPSDFGILITPENIESHLAKIRADREVWARNNPDEVKLVQDIKHEVEAKENEFKR